MKMKLIFFRNQVVFLCLFSYYCCWTYVQGQVASLNSTEFEGNSSEIVSSTPVYVSTRTPRRYSTSISSASSSPGKSSTAATETVSCNPEMNTGCPKDWFLIYENTCMYISERPIYYFYSFSISGTCSPFGANYLQEKNLTTDLRKCILNRLSNNLFSEVRTIRISNDKVLNLKTNNISNLFTSRYGTPAAFVVCTINKGMWEAVEIKQFNLHISDPKTGINRTENLLQLNETFLTIEESEDLLTFICSATGYPFPNVKIARKMLYSNMDIASGNLLVTAKINTASCDHSGIYVCETVNGFGTQSVEKKLLIKHSPEFTRFSTSKTGYSYYDQSITLGDSATINCVVKACPPPKVLSLTDHTHLEILSVWRNTSITYIINKVQCSDIGQYVCLAEEDNGDIIERKIDLTIYDRCPVQLCKGESTSRIISAALGETVTVSVCLVSFESVSWIRQRDSKRIVVTINRDPTSKILQYANITIFQIQESDYYVHKIGFRNIYESLFYDLTLIYEGVRPVKTSPIPEQSTLEEKKVTIKGDQQLQTSTPMQQPQRQQQQHQQQQQEESTSSEKTNFLMITLPIVSINIIVIIIFSVIIYINRERLLLKPSSRKAYHDFGKDSDRYDNSSLLISGNSMERLRPGERETDTEI